MSSKVWRPERDERYAGNAIARKERRHLRHLNRDMDMVSRLRTTALRKEVGRQMDGGSAGRWARYDRYGLGYGSVGYGRGYGYGGSRYGYGGSRYGYGNGYGGSRYGYGNGYGGYGSYGYGAYGRGYGARGYGYNQYRRPYSGYGYGSGYGRYPRSYGYGAYPAMRGYSRSMSYYPSNSYYYPRSRTYGGTGYNGYYPSYGGYGGRGMVRPPVIRRSTLGYGGYGGGAYGRPRISPLQQVPRLGGTRMYMEDGIYSSSYRNPALNYAAHDVRRARQELQGVRAARRAEEGMEMLEVEKGELDRARHQRNLAAVEREIGREVRNISRNQKLDNLEELRDIAASRRASHTPMISRPTTPFSSAGALVPYEPRPSTPYGSRSLVGTPRSPYISRPPSPAYSTYSMANAAAGPSTAPLALPAPPRTPGAAYYGLDGRRSPGRRAGWDENESILGDLANDMRNSNLNGRRTPLPRY